MIDPILLSLILSYAILLVFTIVCASFEKSVPLSPCPPSFSNENKSIKYLKKNFKNNCVNTCVYGKYFVSLQYQY